MPVPEKRWMRPEYLDNYNQKKKRIKDEMFYERDEFDNFNRKKKGIWGDRFKDNDFYKERDHMSGMEGPRPVEREEDEDEDSREKHSIYSKKEKIIEHSKESIYKNKGFDEKIYDKDDEKRYLGTEETSSENKYKRKQKKLYVHEDSDDGKTKLNENIYQKKRFTKQSNRDRDNSRGKYNKQKRIDEQRYQNSDYPEDSYKKKRFEKEESRNKGRSEKSYKKDKFQNGRNSNSEEVKEKIEEKLQNKKQKYSEQRLVYGPESEENKESAEFGRDEVEKLNQNRQKNVPKDETKSPKTVKLSNATREFYNERMWRDGIVPYIIHSDGSYNIKDMRARLEEVIDILNQHTCVRMEEITEDEALRYNDYLVLDTSSDYITGKVGGKQNFGVLEMFRGGQHRQHTAMMVMAMLGFYFEVAREDRDRYIRVHNRHIRPDKLHHFEKLVTDATFPLPYDYKSATHPAWQFWRRLGRTGISSVATFKDKDPDGSVMKSLGQNKRLLSNLDIIKINTVYGTRCFEEESSEEI